MRCHLANPKVCLLFQERGEFHTLLRRLAPTMEPSERDAAFDQIDGDGSGALDYDEFVAWYNSPEIKQMCVPHPCEALPSHRCAAEA